MPVAADILESARALVLSCARHRRILPENVEPAARKIATLTAKALLYAR